MGATRQVARRLWVVLEIKALFWLPESYTDPNSRMENSAGAVFSRMLTKGRNFGFVSASREIGKVGSIFADPHFDAVS